jgi:hypothetical protein
MDKIRRNSIGLEIIILGRWAWDACYVLEKYTVVTYMLYLYRKGAVLFLFYFQDSGVLSWRNKKVSSRSR